MAEEKKQLIALDNQENAIAKLIEFCKQNRSQLLYAFLFAAVVSVSLYMFSKMKQKLQSPPQIKQPPILLPRSNSCKRYEII